MATRYPLAFSSPASNFYTPHRQFYNIFQYSMTTVGLSRRQTFRQRFMLNGTSKHWLLTVAIGWAVIERNPMQRTKYGSHENFASAPHWGLPSPTPLSLDPL